MYNICLIKENYKIKREIIMYNICLEKDIEKAKN